VDRTGDTMIYEWKCPQCGEIAEVERVADDYQLGPSQNEAVCMHPVEDYTRIITSTSVPFETLRDKGVFERTKDYF